MASIIATLTGDLSITPIVIAQKAAERGWGCGPSSWFITAVAEDYGLTTEWLGSIHSSLPSVDEISRRLREGWMFHVVGRGSRVSNSPLDSGGHFIGVRGITPEGKWLVFDSAHGGVNNEKEFYPDEIYPYADSWYGVRR